MKLLVVSRGLPGHQKRLWPWGRRPGEDGLPHWNFTLGVAYFFCKMASAMRAKINTHITGEIPVNMYAIALATSGYGKGRSVYIIEQELMRGFKRRFIDSTFAPMFLPSPKAE